MGHVTSVMHTGPMASLRRYVQSVVGACILLLLAGCAGSGPAATDTEPAAEPEPTATVVVAPSPAGEPSATAVAVPGPTPTGTVPILGPVEEIITVDLWLPRIGQDGLFADIDREVSTADYPGDYAQLKRVVELWTEGATEYEENAGVLDFDWRFSHCDEPFRVEAPEQRAIITLCSRTVDDDRVPASLEKTLIEAGLIEHVAVLTADAETCAGTPVGDDPLWCLEAQDKWTDAYRCPINRSTSSAAVAGVEEWANTRVAPSLDAELARQLFPAQLVRFYPSTLSYDGLTHWWVTVELPGGINRCASAAAHLLEDAFGNLAQITPGLSYDVPTTGTWTLFERESILDQTGWGQEESFATGVSLRILDGTRIDDQLERQLAFYEDNGYDFPTDWYREVTVPGADRAVRYVFVSESGDSGVDVLLFEVDDFTIEASTSVYIEDRPPRAELDAFLESFSVDRATFLQAMAPVQVSRVTLHRNDYVPVEEVAATYTGARACGTPYDYWRIDESGRFHQAGNLLSPSPIEFDDGYLLWEVYCEGGDPVTFAVGQVEEYGSITRLGFVDPTTLGVRADYGSITVNADESITFTGTSFGGEDSFTDTFQVGDVLEQLGAAN